MSRQGIIANLVSHFANRCGGRSRRSLAGNSNPPEILECRTLLSAVGAGIYINSFDFQSGTISVTLFDDTNASIGVDGNGKLLINGTVARGDVAITMGLGTEGDLDASAIKSLIVNGGDGDNCVDLSGVTVDDFPNLTEVRVSGGNGDDEIIGSEFAEVLNGNQGDDTISGANGHDVLLGGGGDDSLSGGNGHDTLRGHSGQDAIFGEIEGEGAETPQNQPIIIGDPPMPDVLPGNDVMFGGAGDDRIEGNGGDDRISGGDGSDVIDGHMGDDLITGGDGDDLIRGWQGNDTLSGNDGNDTILSGGHDDLVFGGNGNDELEGTGSLVVVGFNQPPFGAGTGNDTIEGGGGDDEIRGAMLATGGAGNDTLGGTIGSNTLIGGDGDDLLSGNRGADLLAGGAGNDTLRGGSGDDTLAGDSGNDILNGNAGNDILVGYSGDDSLLGGAGADLLIGLDGSDRLNGQGGSQDTLVGGSGEGSDLGDQIVGDAAEHDESFARGLVLAQFFLNPEAPVTTPSA